MHSEIAPTTVPTCGLRWNPTSCRAFSKTKAWSLWSRPTLKEVTGKPWLAHTLLFSAIRSQETRVVLPSLRGTLSFSFQYPNRAPSICRILDMHCVVSLAVSFILKLDGSGINGSTINTTLSCEFGTSCVSFESSNLCISCQCNSHHRNDSIQWLMRQ